MKMLAGPMLCSLRFILDQSRVFADKMEGHVLEGVKRNKKEEACSAQSYQNPRQEYSTPWWLWITLDLPVSALLQRGE